ncbi:MAG: hypothetical protein Q9162_003653 [Coniocarpon cinnabarinum]
MASPKQWTIKEPYLDLKCKLGEGPHYDERVNEFRFLDIDSKKIHFVDPSKGPSSLRTISHPGFSIGVIADIDGHEDEFMYAGEFAYGIMNRHTGEHRSVKDIYGGDPDAEEKKKRCRMNDGNVDSAGRFFAGTFVDPSKDAANVLTPGEKTNALYRYDRDGSLRKVIDRDVVIPNGTSWTYDDKIMYYTDTPKGIYKYDYDIETGAFSNQRTFFESGFAKNEGWGPDGHVMDEQEHLWVALFGAGKVVRLDPKGEVVAEVLIPGAKKISCPCFVGTELWITTIGIGEDSGEQGGMLFKVDVGVKGKKKHMVYVDQ